MTCLAPDAAERMRTAALAFVAALDPQQRTTATAPFDTPDHRDWTYLPGPRPGLALRDMTSAQRDLAMALLDTGLSSAGAATARDVMKLDSVLRELERQAGEDGWERRHEHHYWVRVLGDPAGDAPWAWRVNGHHLAVHLTVVGDALAGTPQFFGANPAVVPHGPQAGWQTLPAEERLARELMSRLDADQRAAAIVDPVAPYDLATRHDPVADIGVMPRGLAYADLDRDQRDQASTLIRHYLGRVVPVLGDSAWQAVRDAGLEQVSFAWAGELAEGPGHPHYYAVTGPSFLIEYDNVQSGANHVHTVWRDVSNDWGQDLLADHHASARH